MTYRRMLYIFAYKTKSLRSNYVRVFLPRHQTCTFCIFAFCISKKLKPQKRSKGIRTHIAERRPRCVPVRDARHTYCYVSISRLLHVLAVRVSRVRTGRHRWRSLCHLSPGSSMVRASHRRSEGCGFDSRLGLRNIFLSLR